jgi:hypothetical protein
MVWPADPGDAGRPAGTLFEESGPTHSGSLVRQVDAPAKDAVPPAEPRGPIDEPGFWDAPDSLMTSATTPVDAAAALEAGAAALDDGETARAAAHLGLAIRINPGLAAPVLDLIRHAPVSAPELDIVRGDAYRLVGHDIDAQRAWAAAAAALARPTREGAIHQEET